MCPLSTRVMKIRRMQGSIHNLISGLLHRTALSWYGSWNQLLGIDISCGRFGEGVLQTNPDLESASLRLCFCLQLRAATSGARVCLNIRIVCFDLSAQRCRMAFTAPVDPIQNRLRYNSHTITTASRSIKTLLLRSPSRSHQTWPFIYRLSPSLAYTLSG